MKSKIHCLVGADIISRISLRRHGLDVPTVDAIAGKEFTAIAFKGGDVLIEAMTPGQGMLDLPRMKQHWLPLDAVTIL